MYLHSYLEDAWLQNLLRSGSPFTEPIHHQLELRLAVTHNIAVVDKCPIQGLVEAHPPGDRPMEALANYPNGSIQKQLFRTASFVDHTTHQISDHSGQVAGGSEASSSLAN